MDSSIQPKINESKYSYLKMQDTVVMEFNISDGYYKLFRPDLMPFIIRNSIIDTSEEKNINPMNIIKNANAMFEFYTHRSLSINRENAKFILNQLGISQKNDLETKVKMMEICKGLSVADDYWISSDINENWNDVNLRDNPLHETLAQIALFGKSLSITGKIRTPELTGLGAYAKAWFRENGVLFLYKAGTKGGNEAQREVQTSKILDCFNVPQVQYSLTEKDGLTVSKCKAMNNADYSIVDAGDIASWCSRNNIIFEDLVKKIDSENYYKTIIVDYLCSNRDRHDGNWGFFMNNKTGEIITLHPLFDHNNCFDKDFMEDETGGFCQLMPGKNQQEAALYAIKKCSFHCIKAVTRDIFLNDQMYFTFMKRAEQLGLYKKRKLTLLDKLKGDKNVFIPVSIEKDDRDNYFFSLEKQKNLQNFVYENKMNPNKKSKEVSDLSLKDKTHRIENGRDETFPTRSD